MIEQIWNKKIVTIIEMNQQDIADTVKPLPLITQFSWNAYIGFYEQIILDYFQMSAPFPYNKQQFNLTLQPLGHQLQPNTIVYHIFQRYNIPLNQPLTLKCNFRTKNQPKQIDLRRHFKNNLKASTAIRYGKYGASILMVEMSINNVENMLNSFRNMNFQRFLGSNNFQSDDLGYLFLIHRAEKIAVKFIYYDIVVQRNADKNILFSQFIQNNFGAQESTKYHYRVHLVELSNLNIKMENLQKYCHPDGYLYIHMVCKQDGQKNIQKSS